MFSFNIPRLWIRVFELDQISRTSICETWSLEFEFWVSTLWNYFHSVFQEMLIEIQRANLIPKKCFVAFCCWTHFPTMPFLISLNNNENWIKFIANNRPQIKPTDHRWKSSACVCLWDVHIRRDCFKKKKFETTFVNNLLLLKCKTSKFQSKECQQTLFRTCFIKEIKTNWFVSIPISQFCGFFCR